jgi:hypothetical protein
MTVVAIASLFLCIFNYNPFAASLTEFIYFYFALMMSLLGCFTIILFYAKIFIKKSEVIYSLFWPSVRQAFLLSIGITTIMVLRGLKLLDLWTGVPILIVVILLEQFFQTKKAKAA